MNIDYRNFAPYKYMEWLVGARQYVMNLDVSTDKKYSEDTNLIADNYERFTGKKEEIDREAFAKNVRYFQMFAATDQNHLFQLNHLKLNGYEKIEPYVNDKKPAIYCTYHIGSYRMLNQFLILKQIPFTLVADQNFIDTQGEQCKKRLEEIQVELYGKVFFEGEVLNAESRTTGLEIIRRIQNGRSILFYIDGNTGVNQFNNDPSKMIPVQFFNTLISARKGIAYLSYKSRTPIFPIYSLRHDWLNNEMIFNDPIFPNPDERIEDYCLHTTSKLFKILEGAISEYPEQWEGWFYINKFILDKADMAAGQKVIENDTNKISMLKFNSEKFSLFEFASKYYLYNKREQKGNEITEDFSQVLKYLHDNDIECDADITINNLSITKDALKELIDHDILQVA